MVGQAIRVSKHPHGGLRVHIIGHRIHHGFLGCLSILFGLYLMYHDRADHRSWLADLIREVEAL